MLSSVPAMHSMQRSAASLAARCLSASLLHPPIEQWPAWPHICLPPPASPALPWLAGWVGACVQVARAKSGIHSLERAQLLSSVVEAGLPVLVATGERDPMAGPAAASRIAERLGGAAPRLAILPRCGHLSHEEAPQVLLDFLQAFLAELGLC
jgi:pimeloyl-ACP methyl ester carboxylesterase